MFSTNNADTKHYRMETPLNHQDRCFLPNLCGLRVVFVVIIIAQLFSFLLILVQTGQQTANWLDLGLVSLYVQWCALANCAVLCMLRPFICRLSDRLVAIISYLVVLLMVFAISELAYWYIYPGARYNMQHSNFVFEDVAIAFILTGPVLRYFYIQHQWREKVRAESEARLQSLQARIRPHFFFNTMNTIASLTRSDPLKAETAVEDLADLFRASLRDTREFHSFAEEILLCKHYLSIEALRLGERLQVTWDVDVIPDDAYVPPLLIQPLLENAIYHGIEPRTEGGAISIRGRFDGSLITLKVENPLPLESEKNHEGNRIAQDNVRDRLHTLFPLQGDMRLTENDDKYSVCLSWPYRNKPDENIDRG